jgi:formyltetrahydrofolate-dependent phosphoribosylglycinamide formyltransferase
LNIAVFVSGRGSNLQAILKSEELRGIVSVVAVVSDKLNCPAFEIAKNHTINTFSVSNIEKSNFITYKVLVEKLCILKTDLIVLAGFLKLIPIELIKVFQNRIINIHPALLPKFGGSGMYGHKVHEAVFNSSSLISGPTVHFVNEEYDTGLIIAQKVVDIRDCRSPDEIAERVLILEHSLLPSVIKKFAENKIIIKNNQVIIEN